MKPIAFEVRESGIHNKGVFAARAIRKKEKVIEYVGERVTKKEADKRGERDEKLHAQDSSNGLVYIFELNNRHDIDGNVTWNLARYINHSCKPNCKIKITKKKIWIVAKRDIASGEELSYNYGYDLDGFEAHPCRCGAKCCVGYIVGKAYWPKLKKQLKKKRLKQERKEKKQRAKLEKKSRKVNSAPTLKPVKKTKKPLKSRRTKELVEA